jgi:DNA polymerase-3 subunit beta
MKFTVNTSDFKSAITKVMKVTPKKSIVSILENVRVEVVNDRCYLKASNLEQFVTTEIDVYHSDSDGAFVFMDTKLLVKAMKFYKDFEITFEVLNDNKVKVSCGNKSAEQLIFSGEENYPETPVLDIANAVEYSYSASKLKERYNLIKYAVSQTDTRPILTGIHFNGNDMVALDGFRLGLNKDTSLNITVPFTMPAQAFNAVDGILEGDITITANHKLLTMKDKNTTFTTRLLDGEYPDYKNFIHNDGESVEVNIKEFNESLKYFKTFNTKEKGCKAIPTVWNNENLSFKNNTGNYESNISVKGEFNFDIGFDMDYMIDGLSQFKSDSVNIRVVSPVAPMVLCDGGDNLALVLPMRIAV